MCIYIYIYIYIYVMYTYIYTYTDEGILFRNISVWKNMWFFDVHSGHIQ